MKTFKGSDHIGSYSLCVWISPPGRYMILVRFWNDGVEWERDGVQGGSARRHRCDWTRRLSFETTLPSCS
jgi:hypothetical protein